MEMDEEFDPVDSLNHLEQTFYTQGYQAGYTHGRLHGIFEGRALGQEKCFDLWEEIGYIEGVALFWREVVVRQGREEGIGQGKGGKGRRGGGKKVSSRAINHIQALLALIDRFPTTNPTPAPGAAPSRPSSSEPMSITSGSGSMSASSTTSAAQPSSSSPSLPETGAIPEVDLAAHLERIRGRYKLLCSTLGIRPRLSVSSNNFGGINDNGDRGATEGVDVDGASGIGGSGDGAGGIVGGIEGPMAGVDTRLLRF